MIVIVEGIDRVGKTTLCNKLHEETYFPIYKHKHKEFNYSKMDNLNETDKMLQLLDLCNILHGNIIFDRFHWSDLVYGILDRNYNIPLAYDNFHKIDQRLINAIIIYVMPTDIEKSSIEHGKDLTKYNQLMEECKKYSFTKVYTCTYLTINDIIKEIKNEYRL